MLNLHCSLTMLVFYLFISFILISGMSTCLYVCEPHASRTHRGQRRMLDLLGMELQTIVISHMGAKNRNPGLWKSTHCSSLRSHLSSTHVYAISLFSCFHLVRVLCRVCVTAFIFQQIANIRPASVSHKRRKGITSSFFIYRIVIHPVKGSLFATHFMPSMTAIMGIEECSKVDSFSCCNILEWGGDDEQ